MSLKMSLKFKPFGNNVIVKAPVVDDKTEAGVILPEELVKEKIKDFDGYYEVLAVGADVKEIKIGDEVMITNSRPNPTIIDGIPCMVVYCGNIFGKKL